MNRYRLSLAHVFHGSAVHDMQITDPDWQILIGMPPREDVIDLLHQRLSLSREEIDRRLILSTVPARDFTNDEGDVIARCPALIVARGDGFNVSWRDEE